MFVDMQLPIDLSNTASELFTATIQIVLIAVASVPALCAIPVMFIVLYLVQHFYLRTSKQLRLFELEATAALVTKISETGSGAGLSTIRAHGWSDVTMSRFLEKLDRSQEPVYLLYAAQRWLQLVLNMIIAGLVVAVLGASIALKSSGRVSPGAVGVAFLNAVTLGETLAQLIIAWTGLETSLGAIARIALFQRQTPAEEEEDSVRGVSRDPGGCGGAICFENVWATYNPPSSEIPTTTTAAEKEETSMTPPGLGHGGPDREWSLRGITLSINPGERIAICGRTGSGKSTMHLALLRMVYTPIGSVFIDGVDHSTLSLEALRNRFLVISQDKLEGFDTLRQALDPHGVFSDARVEAVLRECGMLDVVMRSYGGLAARREDCRFSAGEEQLLRVARVVLDVERENSGAPDGDGKGRIVLLDEVTSRYVVPSGWWFLDWVPTD
jgi:ABC-type multidrug transport system fused ATPase/permease subunit